MKQYDVIVIGGGPGGYTSALQAANLGKTTALIEADSLGGTCLNRGCIPSKTWLKYAEVIESIEKFRDWGLQTGEIHVSLEKMRQRKHDIILRLRKGIEYLLKQGKIDVFTGWGTLQTEKTVQIKSDKGDEVIRGEKIIIATGSSTAIPPIKGLKEIAYDTSDTIFDIKEMPKSVVIIGGGVIGVEFACIFRALNIEVSVIEMADRIIPQEDVEASKVLTKALKKKGIKIYTNTSVVEVGENNSQKTVICQNNDKQSFSIEAESIVVCVGRKPNVSAVRQISLALDGPFIKVNEKMETNIPGVYAIGDVVGGYQLAHVASSEGIVAANNSAGIKDSINYKVVPRCIYSFPEVASVGLTEEAAKSKGINVQIERFDLVASGKAVSSGDTDGFVKVVYDGKYGEIIGVTMVGPHVTEMISEASAFMYLEGTVEEMAKMIHPHPSISESYLEAAQHAVIKLKRQGLLIS